MNLSYYYDINVILFEMYKTIWHKTAKSFKFYKSFLKPIIFESVFKENFFIEVELYFISSS